MKSCEKNSEHKIRIIGAKAEKRTALGFKEIFVKIIHEFREISRFFLSGIQIRF